VKDPLLLLAPSDLRTLAVAIASGRLSEPYLATSVQRFLSPGTADEVASSLQELAALGVQTRALTKLLELLATAIADRPPLEDIIDLVTTGPDSGGLASRDTSVVVRDLFHNAKDSVVVVGYAVHQGREVFQALADRMIENPKLDVRMYLDIQRKIGDTSTASELVRRFENRFRSSQWPPGKPLPQVFYDPRSLELERGKCAALHAKCIVVDGCELFLSSANFTEAAQQKNIELGVLFHSAPMAARVLRFFTSLVESGRLKKAF